MPTSSSIEPQPKKRKISFIDSNDTNSDCALDVSDEIANYSNMSILVKEDSCPLEFFRNHAKQFPILSLLVKKLFCMTASSVPCEQLFSKAGEVISIKRSRLHPSLAEMLILLDQNI